MGDVQQVPHVASVDCSWMTQVLSAAGLLHVGRVVDMTRETCGTGQLGDSYRFTLSYDPPAAGPTTVVGKFPSEDTTSREFGRVSGYYRKEIRFYAELASSLPIAVPTSIHAALAENETDFVLLMEDLAPARQVDQNIGCTPDQAVLTVEQLGALHASTWRDSRLARREWLAGTTAMFNAITDNFAKVVHTFPELCGDLVPGDDLALAGLLSRHTDSWKRVLNEAQCLWHSDVRADNLLFDARGGTRPVVILDWQGVGYGRGTLDVALFLGTSLSTEDRRSHERDLLAHYHQAMVRHGATDYDASTCWEDYRLNAIYGLQVGIYGLGAVKRTVRGDEMWRVWIERTAAHVRDLDSFSVLAHR